jgi:hypothetical protein
MARSRKKKRKQRQPPYFVFTTQTIDITAKALQRFERSLHQADHRNEKVVFAEQTMQQIKGKLAALQRSVNVLGLTAFDYNERIILTQAVRMYMLELLSAPQTAKNARELSLCRALIACFRVDPGKT